MLDYEKLRTTRSDSRFALDTERKITSILKVLSESSEPLGSAGITRELKRHGTSLSERAAGNFLRITDERGFTMPMGHGGRVLTPLGLEEAKMALAPDQVGFVLEKLELLAFKTTFNPAKRTGDVPINTSLIDETKFRDVLKEMADVFKAGIFVSERVAIASAGEKLGSVVIPRGKIGFATVSGVVISGVLLRIGIPMDSGFGGVLEIKNGKPRRFVGIINYAGTSLDPSEQYIRARMTDVKSTVRTGNGKILAEFREIPAPSRWIVDEKIVELRDASIGGVYALGETSESICQVGVGVNHIGMVLLGGLNPVAAAVEARFEIESIAESGLIDFGALTSFWKR